MLLLNRPTVTSSGVNEDTHTSKECTTVGSLTWFLLRAYPKEAAGHFLRV